MIGGDVTLSSAGNLTVHYLDADSTTWTGRLGPGEYVLEGRSSGGASLDSFAGAVFFAQWLVMPVANPFITSQPGDQIVNCGRTVNFSVGTSGPSGNYSYQWRRNLIPLINSAHVNGVTTAMLILNNVCASDSGYYDVVVTGTQNGSPVSEPSRLAHLGIGTTTAIQDPIGDLAPSIVMTPSPNPFRSATSVRYELATPIRLRAAVYNLAGARVRTLLDDVVSGSGFLTWDGTTQSGDRSPRGIYFLHVDLGGKQQTSKLVLVE